MATTFNSTQSPSTTKVRMSKPSWPSDSPHNIWMNWLNLKLRRTLFNGTQQRMFKMWGLAEEKILQSIGGCTMDLIQKASFGLTPMPWAWSKESWITEMDGRQAAHTTQSLPIIILLRLELPWETKTVATFKSLWWTTEPREDLQTSTKQRLSSCKIDDYPEMTSREFFNP